MRYTTPKTNESKSMLVLALGSNACTPCMTASLLENSGVLNATPPETRTTAKNQAESRLAKLLFFNRPGRFPRNPLLRKRPARDRHAGGPTLIFWLAAFRTADA